MQREGSPWQGLSAVTLKELSDHFSSARMRVLEWLVILTAAAALYGALQGVRSTTAEDPFVFLRLFTDTQAPLPSFASILGFLIPLVAIGLGFDAINGEYSRRTMSRILSQPIYRDALLLGKFLAGLATLAISLLCLWLIVIGVSLLALQLQGGFAGLDVLGGDLLELFVGGHVGGHLLDGGELGDLPDALRVEDVVLVQHLDRGLLQEVDGAVLEHVAVEVTADDADDLVLDLLTLGVELLEVEALAHRLERLRELGLEEVLQRLLVGGARAADGLRHLQHVLARLVHAHEEGHLDVRADVVLADEAFLATAVDLHRLQGDVHHLGPVDDREHHGAGEGDDRLGLERVDDEHLALVHLPVEPDNGQEDASK